METQKVINVGGGVRPKVKPMFSRAQTHERLIKPKENVQKERPLVGKVLSAPQLGQKTTVSVQNRPLFAVNISKPDASHTIKSVAGTDAGIELHTKQCDVQRRDESISQTHSTGCPTSSDQQADTSFSQSDNSKKGIVVTKALPSVGEESLSRGVQSYVKSKPCPPHPAHPAWQFSDEFEQFRATASSGGSLYGLLRRQEQVSDEADPPQSDSPPNKVVPKRQRSQSLTPNPETISKLLPGARTHMTNICECMDPTELIPPKSPQHPRRFVLSLYVHVYKPIEFACSSSLEIGLKGQGSPFRTFAIIGINDTKNNV